MSCAPHPARPSSASTPHSESDSRSNAFRIKRSRTPVQLPKFDVQPFQRVTNSRLFPCDRSPLVSGDYKLWGGGDTPVQKQRFQTLNKNAVLYLICFQAFVQVPSSQASCFH